MRNDNFNNYTLKDEEVLKIIKDFKGEIKRKSIILGKYNEDCEQEIVLRIYKSLTRSRNNKKI